MTTVNDRIRAARQRRSADWLVRQLQDDRALAMDRLRRAYRDQDHNLIPRAEKALKRLMEEA